MSSNSNQISFLINFSNKRRQLIENQKTNTNIKFRNYSILELIGFQYLPVLITSTILAPLNRIKVIQQCQDLIIFKNNNLSSLEIIKQLYKEKGLRSFFIGNYIYSLRIIAQISAQAFIFDRIKYKGNIITKSLTDKRILIPNLNHIVIFFSSCLTSIITLLITYPFDLAYGRCTTVMGAERRIMSLTETFITNKKESRLFKMYNGLNYAFLQTLVYSTITLFGYQLLRNYNENNKNNTYYNLISTSMISLIASIISYPLDTAKRRVQILSIIDNSYNNSIIYKGYMNGFGMHLARSIPFSFIQYQILCFNTKFLKNKNNK